MNPWDIVGWVLLVVIGLWVLAWVGILATLGFAWISEKLTWKRRVRKNRAKRGLGTSDSDLNALKALSRIARR